MIDYSSLIRGGKRSASAFFLGGSLVRRKTRMERCVLGERVMCLAYARRTWLRVERSL